MQSPEQIQKDSLENTQEEIDVTELDKREVPVHGHQEADFLKGSIAEALGHERSEVDKYDIELNRILSWANSKGATNPEDVMWEIRYLATRLGTPGLGESRIKWLYQYIFLEQEEQIMAEQRRKMEGLSRG